MAMMFWKELKAVLGWQRMGTGWREGRERERRGRREGGERKGRRRGEGGERKGRGRKDEGEREGRGRGEGGEREGRGKGEGGKRKGRGRGEGGKREGRGREGSKEKEEDEEERHLVDVQGCKIEHTRITSGKELAHLTSSWSMVSCDSSNREVLTQHDTRGHTNMRVQEVHLWLDTTIRMCMHEGVHV